jgi:hypothetical protein
VNSGQRALALALEAKRAWTGGQKRLAGCEMTPTTDVKRHFLL